MLLLEGDTAIFKAGDQSLPQEFFPSIRGAYDKARTKHFTLAYVVNAIAIEDINAEAIQILPAPES